MRDQDLPKEGLSPDDLFAELDVRGKGDVDWRGGHTWSLVFYAGEELLDVSKRAYNQFYAGNALSPFAFPSLQRFENEVVHMTLGMLHAGAEAVGTMTSGGTESILMAVKAARDKQRAEHPEVDAPELLLPQSAHPAFDKAAHYLGLRTRRIPLREDFRADVEAAESMITPNTALMVGSAPGYPHGVVDPIAELASLAEARGVSFHVDACLGGFFLPWLEKLGYAVPPFDFRVSGVTSISADIHKYGYGPRGTSTILYRSEAYRRHQFFAQVDWPGGLYGSPSMTGSRPGGAIAAAWAVMRYLGEDGYLRLAKQTMDTTLALREGIEAIDGLSVLGNPEMSVFAIGSEELDLFRVAQGMQDAGWNVDAQHRPAAMHMMVNAAHAQIVEPFLEDLRQVVERSRTRATGGQTMLAAMYGMAASATNDGPVEQAIVQLIGELFPPRPKS